MWENPCFWWVCRDCGEWVFDSKSQLESELGVELTYNRIPLSFSLTIRYPSSGLPPSLTFRTDRHTKGNPDVTTVAASESSPSLLGKHHFLLRRLHSLTGVMPIGVFVIFHLFTNAQMIWGALGMKDSFQHEVEFIHNLPALLLLEIFGLWLPIGFHAALGLWYTFTGKNNVGSYKYNGNVRYVLQRVTGIIALIFIFFHIAILRWRWDVLGWYTPFYAYSDFGGEKVELSSASLAIAFNGGPEGSIIAMIIITLFYIVGVYAAVYHWSNGLWTAAITWGITTTPQSFKRWGYVCAAMGLTLSFFVAVAIYGSLVYKPDAKELAAWKYEAGMAQTETVAGYEDIDTTEFTLIVENQDD